MTPRAVRPALASQCAAGLSDARRALLVIRVDCDDIDGIPGPASQWGAPALPAQSKAMHCDVVAVSNGSGQRARRLGDEVPRADRPFFRSGTVTCAC